MEAAMTVSMLTIQSEQTINPQMSEALMKENLILAAEDTGRDPQALRF